MIPRIIHQSYTTPGHPYPREWQHSWIENHPDWIYRFHTDADNRRLVSEHFPQFLNAFDMFPKRIMQADFARFLYMYLWGGVYADLDYVSLKPLAPLIAGIAHMGIPELPDNPYYQYHNALLISEAQNSFWLMCAEHAVKYFWSHPPTNGRRPGSFRVEWLAGPLRLQASLQSEQPGFTAL